MYRERKTHKQNFHGIVPEFLFMCFLPIRNDSNKTHEQIVATHPVPGQSRTFVYVYAFILSLLAWRSPGKIACNGGEVLPK